MLTSCGDLNTSLSLCSSTLSRRSPFSGISMVDMTLSLLPLTPIRLHLARVYTHPDQIPRLVLCHLSMHLQPTPELRQIQVDHDYLPPVLLQLQVCTD